MPKKGDYQLIMDVPSQQVASHPQRHGVMFNPSSSRSRLHVRDAGQRYEVRLTAEGTVQYSVDGAATWVTVRPLPDLCTGQQPATFVSHDKLRAGEPLSSVPFDMMAVGRGRIVAKERGTDRIFHTVLDEVSRTHDVKGAGCGGGLNASDLSRREDPPVPGFYMKLDPEFFSSDAPSVVVPPEAERTYSDHPASLRLPVFAELLRMGISDVMLVMQRPRVWYLVDARAPLLIVGPEDLRIEIDDIVTVFNEQVIRDILDAALTGVELGLTSELQAWFRDELVKLLPGLTTDDRTRDDLARGFQGIDIVIHAFLQSLLAEVGKWLADNVADVLAERLIGVVRDSVATKTAANIKKEGYVALVLPVLVTVGFFASRMRGSQLLATDAYRNLALLLRAPLPALPEIEPLADAISAVMGLARRREELRWRRRTDTAAPDDWTPTPDHPPRWMPSYRHLRYLRRFGGLSGRWRALYSGADRLREVVMAANADGRLEAFGLSPDNRIWHSWQGTPDGEWNGGWGELYSPNDQLRSVAAARNHDGRLELVGVGPNDTVYHTWQAQAGGAWHGWWDPLYGEDAKLQDLTLTADAAGCLHVFGFARGSGSVWHTGQVPGSFEWSGVWEELTIAGGVRSLAAAPNQYGRLEVFGVTPQHQVWRKQQAANGSWSNPWVRFHGADDRVREIRVASNADGRLEVFGLAPDDTSWHTWEWPDGTWSGWAALCPADNQRSLAAVARTGDGRLEVFSFSSDDRLWHTSQTAPNGEWTGRWKKLYTGAGALRSLAVGTGKNGGLQAVAVSQDFQVWQKGQTAEPRFSIQFSKVLDLGVGYSHWAEQWHMHFGGEIHSLLQRRPLMQQEQYNLTQYRFLNGPVIDGDAFNDGTCNFYMLVKLGTPGSTGAGLRQRYAILWIDEQTYFTQRWRLVHPTDDVLGDLFSLMHMLKDNPEWFPYSDQTSWLTKFWSPFTDDLIDDDSRMAVRRQIIVLTGYNRAAARREIYTMCFNYGVSDYTWRWRLFPPGEHLLMDAAAARDPDAPLPSNALNGPAAAYVAVNTLDLRDDTTLHVRGSKRSAGGALRPGRWVQRYLPADCRHVPRPHQLTGGRPVQGFGHEWDFVSEAAYRRADRFYQFGVYDNQPDSRCQYYEVELLPDAAGAIPTVEQVVGRVWHNHASENAPGGCLSINTNNLNWSLIDPADGSVALTADNLLTERRKLPTMSMYEPTTRFRLFERKPLGLIAVFHDKRDDELQSATGLPQETVFGEDLVDATIPAAWGEGDGAVASRTPTRIRVLVKSNKRVLQPPNVRRARITRQDAGGKRIVQITFWTPQTEQQVCENIWKVTLAAIDETGVVPIFSRKRFPSFVRKAQPDGPLPIDFGGDLGAQWRYDYRWTDLTADQVARVDRFCTPAAQIEYATSLWFEDIVGHRSLAEETQFRGNPAPPTTLPS